MFVISSAVRSIIIFATCFTVEGIDVKNVTGYYGDHDLTPDCQGSRLSQDKWIVVISTNCTCKSCNLAKDLQTTLLPYENYLELTNICRGRSSCTVAVQWMRLAADIYSDAQDIYYTCLTRRNFFYINRLPNKSRRNTGLLLTSNFPRYNELKIGLKCTLDSNKTIKLWILDANLKGNLKCAGQICVSDSTSTGKCKNGSVFVKKGDQIQMPQPTITSKRVTVEADITCPPSMTMGTRLVVLFESESGTKVDCKYNTGETTVRDLASTTPASRYSISTTSLGNSHSPIETTVVSKKLSTSSAVRNLSSSPASAATSVGSRLQTNTATSETTTDYTVFKTTKVEASSSDVGPNGTGKRETQHKAPVIAGSVGGAVGVLTILAVAVACVIYRRRRRHPSEEKETELEDNPIYEGGPPVFSSPDDQVTYQSTYEVLNKDIYTQLDKNKVGQKANGNGPDGGDGGKNSVGHLQPTYEALQVADNKNHDSQTPRNAVDGSEYTPLNFPHEDKLGSINDKSHPVYFELQSDKERIPLNCENHHTATDNDYFVLETDSRPASGLNETEAEPTYFEMEKDAADESNDQYFVLESDGQDNQNVTSDPTYSEVEQNRNTAFMDEDTSDDKYFVLESGEHNVYEEAEPYMYNESHPSGEDAE